MTDFWEQVGQVPSPTEYWASETKQPHDNTEASGTTVYAGTAPGSRRRFSKLAILSESMRGK